jgi:hypothetical protein
MSPTPDLNELGFYVLAGAPKTPVDHRRARARIAARAANRVTVGAAH